MRHKDDKKAKQIREKAIQMIVKQGFDGFSMQKLAKAANISVATIYIYFENKETLITQIYNEIVEDFESELLNNFDPDMSFEEGLWLQWQNRFNHYVKNPNQYLFWELFRNSHFMNHKNVHLTNFKNQMTLFIQNAIKNKELKELPFDVYWSIAYSPFYTLLKFHINNEDMRGNPYTLSDENMRLTFDLILKALKD